jgi:hypothetical protein
MRNERRCTRCKHIDVIPEKEPCYSCLCDKERRNFEPNNDPAKKAKIVSRLSSWQYTIGYVQGILVESDIKDKSVTDLLEGLAADIQGFVSDVLNDME